MMLGGGMGLARSDRDTGCIFAWRGGRLGSICILGLGGAWVGGLCMFWSASAMEAWHPFTAIATTRSTRVPSTDSSPLSNRWWSQHQPLSQISMIPLSTHVSISSKRPLNVQNSAANTKLSPFAPRQRPVSIPTSLA